MIPPPFFGKWKRAVPKTFGTRRSKGVDATFRSSPVTIWAQFCTFGTIKLDRFISEKICSLFLKWSRFLVQRSEWNWNQLIVHRSVLDCVDLNLVSQHFVTTFKVYYSSKKLTHLSYLKKFVRITKRSKFLTDDQKSDELV